MVTVDDFLRRGYFPKELPPLFTTSKFADLTPDVDLPNANDCASLVRYSHSKFASTRRQLSIPHPYQFHKLVVLLCQNWTDLEEQVWSASPYSLSRPTDNSLRAVKGEYDFRDLPLKRAEVRASGRYIFRTDIASFYHSIYTHSIPWAIHGKEVAKADRSNNLWGNIADRWSRNMQDQQTVGVPVGPDTSFVLAETILCRVDALITERLTHIEPSILGFRFIDDFEFVCVSQHQAEEVLAHVQDVLAQFELNLNARKTSICELPQEIDTQWTDELQNFPLDSDSRLMRYFTRAFELTRTYPGEPVLKYAVGRLINTGIWRYSGYLLQHLMLQASIADPGILQVTLSTLSILQDSNSNAVDTESLSRALNLLIQRHSPLRHGSEVAWCIWAAAVFGISLTPQSSQMIARIEDDVVALTALFCEQYNVFSEQLDKTLWQDIVNNNSSAKEHWLLVYEAVGKEWLNAPNNGDLDGASEYLRNLREAGVEFIDQETSLNMPSAPSFSY